MVREIAWYLESGRFSNLAEEMEVILRNYENAKKSGQDENVLETLREDARTLFEEHCVRSGLRDSETSFINIDAEFFNGNALDESAMNSFIKNIIKGHCYQKVLWTYMGTTESFTAISRAEMANQGLRYDDYLPLEYKKNQQVKRPLEEQSGSGTELFYMYSDGTVRKEYNPEKAKFNFNTLEDKSGVDWKAGYDPNGKIKKDGWHGDYDRDGSWVRVDEKEGENRAVVQGDHVFIELIKNGDSAILYDPGMLLLEPPAMMYLTEIGEPYGNLSMDREQTVNEIRESLKKMGVTGIGAVGGIAGKPELLSAYQTLLGDTALPKLKIADNLVVRSLKEEHEAAVLKSTNEAAGLALERKLRIAGKHGADAASVLAAVLTEQTIVPLSPRKKSDGIALGLSEDEAGEISAMPVNSEYEEAYDTILSNLFASWAYYESGLNRTDAARLVKEYLENDSTQRTEDKNVLPVITAQTSLGEIICGGMEKEQDGAKIFASGIPGVFSEIATVDFYDEKTRGKYLKSLERKNILPKGGSASVIAALETLPVTNGEKRAELNRGLTRALSQYNVIAMSTGMPIKELIEAVKATAGFGDSGNAALGRKIYYELPAESLIEEAGKENRQSREVSLENESKNIEENVIVIGGVRGPALDEVLLTREKLLDRGFSEEEADKAQPFLHDIRFASDEPVIPAFLLEALSNNSIKTAGELQRSILNTLDANDAVSYNLSTDGGLQAYFNSGRAAKSKISRKDIQTLIRDNGVRKPSFASVPADMISKVEPRYKADGNIIPQNRSASRGLPEKIRPAGAIKEDEQSFLVLEGGDKDTGVNVVNFAGLNREALEQEYGYSADEAEEAVQYLRGITIPAGKESYFKQNLAPVFGDLLKGTSRAGVLKERVRERFGRHGGMSFSPSMPARNTPQTSFSGAVPFEFTPVNNAFESIDNSNTDSALTPSAFSATTPDISSYKTDKAVNFEQHNTMEDTTVGGTGNIAVAENAERVMIFPERQERDAELERLRKVEENYERDKAAIAKQKQPALARSESHDVGHAEGTGDAGNPNQFIKELSDRVFYNLKRNAGV